MAQASAAQNDPLLYAGWSVLQLQLSSGSDFLLPDSFPLHILTDLTTKLQEALGPAVVVTFKRKSGCIMFDVTDKAAEKAESSHKTKIPRPPNPWILFRQHKHFLIKAENPSLTNNEICKYLLLQDLARF